MSTKELEQACLDGTVLLQELQKANVKLNAPLMARCDAVLFQW